MFYLQILFKIFVITYLVNGQCNYQCSTCVIWSNTYICDTCPSTRTLNSLNCDCMPGYYDDGSSQQCQDCHYTCDTCTGPLNSHCTTCDQPTTLRIYTNVSGGTGNCDCPSLNYFDNPSSQICLDCHNTCLSCNGSNNNQCLSCDTNQNRILWNNQCICNEGFRENLGICQITNCHLTCNTCSGTSFQECDNCYSFQYRYLDQNQCKCQPRYYDNSTTTCAPCHYSCYECDNAFYNSCTYCSLANDIRVPSKNTCVCNFRQYEIYGQSKCLECHYSCLYCTGPDEDQCKQCLSTDFRILNTFFQTCKCDDGYYDDNDPQCKVCDSTCRTCDKGGPLGCLTCELAFNRMLGDAECICADGFYQVGSNLVCTACHYSCRRCTSTYMNSCTDCMADFHRTLTSGKCICDDLYYDDGKNSMCAGCHYSCATCQAKFESSCLTCSTTWHREQFGSSPPHSCICSTGYYDNGSNSFCQSCHPQCRSCNGSGNNKCTSCNLSSQHRALNGSACTCIDRYFEEGLIICASCHYSCLTCTVSGYNKCLSCSSSDNREFNNGQCICKLGFFDVLNQNVCDPCNYSCITCSGGSQNQCLQCSSFHLRQFVSDQNACKCIERYYDNLLSICEKCHRSCLTCNGSNDSNCQSCLLNDGREIQGTYCVCTKGYYDNGKDQYCEKCHYSCETCDGPNDNDCNSCDDAKNRNFLNLTTCNCKERHYDSGTPTCSRCYYQCYRCYGPAKDQCIECYDQDQRYYKQKECPCLSHYYDVPLTNSCQECNYKCKDCIEIDIKCTSCPLNSNRTFNSSLNTCECTTGYYDDGTYQCQPCHYTCWSCSSFKVCTSCLPNTFRSFDNTSFACNCQSHYYDTNLDEKVCAQCHYSCQDCINNQETCTSCPLLSFRIDSPTDAYKCPCTDGYYDIGAMICNKCFETCKTCVDLETKCLSCYDHSIRHLSNNRCVCDDGYIDLGDLVCDQCHYTCALCEGEQTKCTQCPDDSFRTLNTTQKTCPCNPNYFDSGDVVCTQCNYDCLFCIDTKYTCTICHDNAFRYFDNNKCLCNDGFYDKGVVLCDICDQKCLTCVSSKDNCTSCDPTKFRKDDIAATNTCPCMDRYFDNGEDVECKPCSLFCDTCVTSSENCTSCRAATNFRDFISSQNKCDCIDGYYEINNPQCAICGPICKTCITSATHCLSCFDDDQLRRFEDNKCICQDGYFDDGAHVCKVCSYECLTCVDQANKCTSCKDGTHREPDSLNFRCNCEVGFFDLGVEICAPCHKACKTCEFTITQCTSCWVNSVTQRIGDTANFKCLCEDGYFDNNVDKNCEKCHHSCQTCFGKDKACTSCDIVGFYRLDLSNDAQNPGCPCMLGFFDSGVLKCSKCSNSCEGCVDTQFKCTSCNTNNTNRIDDASNSYLCPCASGYFDEGNEECSVCSYKCRRCEIHKDNCLSCIGFQRVVTPECNCEIGYYDNKEPDCLQCKFQCKSCIEEEANCIECLGNRVNKPACFCPNGYYEDNTVNCPKCPHKCVTCISKKECVLCRGDRENSPNCICRDHFFDDSQSEDCQICDYTCEKCEKTEDTCLTCGGNRVLMGTECKCEEGAVSYTKTPFCSNCDTAIVSVNFSDDLTSIQVKFEFAIQFQFEKLIDERLYCENLLEQETIDLIGLNPICQVSIDDPQVLLIIVGLQAQININNEVKILPNKLKHTHCKKKLNMFMFTEIQTPINNLNPKVTLQYSLMPVSLCASTQIKFGYQEVDGNRPLKNIEWKLIQIKPDGQNTPEAQSLIQTQLDQANQKQLKILELKELSLPELAEIQFEVSYENFIGTSGSSQVGLSTLSQYSPYISIAQDQELKFYRWQRIELKAIYKNVKCDSGSVDILKEALQLTWFEAGNNNEKATPFFEEKKEVEYVTDPELQTSILEIPPYQVWYSTDYQIVVRAGLLDQTKSRTSSEYQVTVKMLKSDITGYIEGGNKMQAFSSPFTIKGMAKDPDFNIGYNMDVRFKRSWECINMNTNNPCQYTDNKPVNLNQSDFQQTFAKRSLQPYNSYLFTYIVQLEGKRYSFSGIRIVIEDDIPVLRAEYNPKLVNRKVNLNEWLEFLIHLQQDQNIDMIDFSTAVVYDYEIQGIIRFAYNKMKVRIWDKLLSYSIKNEVTLRISGHDPRFQMPSLATVTLKLNFPPTKLQYRLVPEMGISLITKFLLTIDDIISENLPIMYRYSFYLSKSHYEEDIVNGTEVNRITILDYSETTQLEFRLPTCLNTTHKFCENSFLLIQAEDSLGGLANFTREVPITQFMQSQYTITDIINELNGYSFPPNKVEETSVFSIFSIELSNIFSQIQDTDPDYSKTVKLMKKLYNSLDKVKENQPALAYSELVFRSMESLIKTEKIFSESQSERSLQEDDEVELSDEKKIMKVEEINEIVDKLIEELGLTLTKEEESQETGNTRLSQKQNQLKQKFVTSIQLADFIYDSIISKNIDIDSVDYQELRKKINILIQSISDQAASNMQIDKLPNDPGFIYEGKQMQLSSYKVTQMRFKGLLIKTTKQGIYGKQEDEEEDLPYRMLERRNSNENNQIKVEPIYKIGVRNLMTNVYWDDAKFKEFIDQNNKSVIKEQLLQDNSLADYVEQVEDKKNEFNLYKRIYQPFQDQSVVIPKVEIIKKNESIIIPRINKDKINLQVTLNSKQIQKWKSEIDKDDNNENEEKNRQLQEEEEKEQEVEYKCVQMKEDKWVSDTCEQEEVNENGKIKMNCYCSEISATTIMQSFVGVFKKTIEDEGQGLSIGIFKIRFQDHIIFYIVLSLTILMIIGIIFGFIKDKIDKKYYHQLDNENKTKNQQQQQQQQHQDEQLITIQAIACSNNSKEEEEKKEEKKEVKTLTERKKKVRLNWNQFCEGIKVRNYWIKYYQKIHEILSIIFVYDELISRPIRFVIVYCRLVLMLSITAFFSSFVNVLQMVLITLAASLVSSLLLKVLRFSSSGNCLLKLLSFVVSFMIILFCWYVIFTLVGMIEVQQANNLAIAFVCAYLTEIVVIEIAIIVLKIMFYPHVHKKIQEKDEEAIHYNLIYFLMVSGTKGTRNGYF